MHEVLVNRLGGLSLPRKSVVRFTDRPDMTLDVYRGRKTTMQQQLLILFKIILNIPIYRIVGLLRIILRSARKSYIPYNTSNHPSLVPPKGGGSEEKHL